MARKTSKATSALRRTWLTRAVVALVAGLSVGAAGGMAVVGNLEPGRPGQTDSLQVMLDSLKNRPKVSGTAPARDARDSRAVVDDRAAPSPADNGDFADDIANDPDAPLVPNVIGLQEGDARDALELAGLTVGSIQFRGARKPAGTVLSASPAPQTKVRLGGAINLVLSDGRAPADSSTFEATPHIGARR